MNRVFVVAGHCFAVSGERLCEAVWDIPGFRPFEVGDGIPLFSFSEGSNAPELQTVQYDFSYEKTTGLFGLTDKGFMLILKQDGVDVLHLWCDEGGRDVWICGDFSRYLLNFALWVGYGVMTLGYDTVAVHSSSVVYKDRAIIFLGESGTGKSTHTRLWCESIRDAVLLNDDSPILRIEEGRVWVYGSPWSGKTHCYKAERHELAGCVRLSQAPFNRIKKLSVLQAYGAIHPSCPPEFSYDNDLYDSVSGIIDRVLSVVPCYCLECLPNKEAALLSCRTLFNDAVL